MQFNFKSMGNHLYRNRDQATMEVDPSTKNQLGGAKPKGVQDLQNVNFQNQEVKSGSVETKTEQNSMQVKPVTSNKIADDNSSSSYWSYTRLRRMALSITVIVFILAIVAAAIYFFVSVSIKTEKMKVVHYVLPNGERGRRAYVHFERKSFFEKKHKNITFSVNLPDRTTARLLQSRSATESLTISAIDFGTDIGITYNHSNSGFTVAMGIDVMTQKVMAVNPHLYKFVYQPSSIQSVIKKESVQYRFRKDFNISEHFDRVIQQIRARRKGNVKTLKIEKHLHIDVVCNSTTKKCQVYKDTSQKKVQEQTKQNLIDFNALSKTDTPTSITVLSGLVAEAFNNFVEEMVQTIQEHKDKIIQTATDGTQTSSSSRESASVDTKPQSAVAKCREIESQLWRCPIKTAKMLINRQINDADFIVEQIGVTF